MSRRIPDGEEAPEEEEEVVGPSPVRRPVVAAADGRSERRIPWRRITRLLRPSRRGVAGMLGLSLGGSLLGLVPPLAVGFLIDALTGQGHSGDATRWALALAGAVLAQAAAYVVSDGLYARVAAQLYQDLRSLMFDGMLRAGAGPEERGGFASRFISDVETAEHLTVGLLDQGAVSVFDLGAALVALGVIDLRLVGVAVLAIAAACLAMRRLQRPAPLAGERRQESLEDMGDSLSASPRHFLHALERVTAAERRLGWVGAANRHGNLAVAGLGPVVVLLVAADRGGLRAGTLVSVYLLAVRAFGAVEGLLDLTLNVELARGAVSRCFALVDAGSRADPRTQLPRVERQEIRDSDDPPPLG